MSSPEKTLFDFCQVVATPGALDVLAKLGVDPAVLLRRHHRGDWGDLCPGDAKLNDEALVNGSRLFSSYLVSPETKVWIITDAVRPDGGRAATTILLPEEY